MAVTSAHLRGELNDEISLPDFQPGVLETEAIIWSYAACVHLELDPRVVFHPAGYQGKSEALLSNFALGIFIGVNQLEDAEMTFSERNAAVSGVEPFPKMIKWLKD